MRELSSTYHADAYTFVLHQASVEISNTEGLWVHYLLKSKQLESHDMIDISTERSTKHIYLDNNSPAD